jgi:uncharacterized protein involved in exopolysaccharide biosynthesis/Mrp family chromosome partitioning ATPase
MEALTGKRIRPLTILSQGWAETTEPNSGRRSQTSDDAVDTFKEVLHSIIKYKRLVVRMIVAGALLAGLAMLLMSPSYTATAYLGVHTRNSGAADVPGSAASAAATEEAAIDTHLTVLLSDAYLRRLLPTLRELDAVDNNNAAALPKWRERASTFFRTAWSKTKELLFLSRHQSSDGEALAALKKRLRVGQERRSRIVSITFADANPQRAAEVANLMAQSYVDELAQQRQVSEKRALSAVAAQSSAVQRELTKIKTELDTSRLGQSSTSQSADLEWQLTTLAQQYEMLLRRRQELATRGLVAEPEVTLIESASQPELPSSLNPLLLIPPVTIFLALFACLLAVILNRFDRTLHTEVEATEALPIPCAGLISSIPLKPGRQPQQIMEQPAIACTKAIRSTLVSLLASDPIPTRSQRFVLVTSSIGGEGKTAVSWNLGFYAAQLGQRVLLLDFGHSFNRPRGDTADLTRVLTQGDPLTDAIQHIQQLGVDYLPAGTSDRDRLWMLANPKMSLLFEQLRDSYDLVVIDAPSLQDAPEVRLLARLVDHVLLAVRSGRTNRDVAKNALQQLARTEDLNANTQFWSILTSESPSNHEPLDKGRSAHSTPMARCQKLKAAVIPWMRIGPAILIGKRSRNT